MLVSKGKIIALDKVNVDESISGDGRWGSSKIGLSKSTWDNINSRVLSSDFIEYSGKIEEEIEKLYGIGSFSGPYASTATIPETEAKNSKTIYLIETTSTGKDIYEEYFYSDTKSAYVCFGEASLDLSTKLDVDTFNDFKTNTYEKFVSEYETYSSNVDNHLSSLDTNKYDASAFNYFYNNDYTTLSGNLTNSANDLYNSASNLTNSASDLYSKKLDKSQSVVTAIDFVNNKTLNVSSLANDTTTLSTLDLVDVSSYYTEGEELAKINGTSIYAEPKVSVHAIITKEDFENGVEKVGNGITLKPKIDTYFGTQEKQISCVHSCSGKYLISYYIMYDVTKVEDISDRFETLGSLLSYDGNFNFIDGQTILGFVVKDSDYYPTSYTHIYEPQIVEELEEGEKGMLMVFPMSNNNVPIDWLSINYVEIDIVKLQ